MKFSIIDRMDPNSIIQRNEIRNKLIQKNWIYDEENPGLVICVGGDGTFLRAIHQYLHILDHTMFVGIHTGTLGFLQEINPKEIDLFLNKLEKNELLEEKISIQKTVVEGVRTIELYSLNEIVIRQMDLKTSRLNIYINRQFLEQFVGDGVLISTTVGSTAYNLSVNGAIVDASIHTLQLTPLSPLNNRAYRNLLNSLILPEHKTITIIPSGDIQDKNSNLMIVVDGIVKKYHHVKQLKTTVSSRRITRLKLPNHHFYTKVHEKFLEQSI